jgi:hypothetical protein
MNLHILEYAGQQVISGAITSISEKIQKGGCAIVSTVIKNKAYTQGKMVDTELRVCFVDKDSISLASWIQQRKCGEKITVLVKLCGTTYFAMRATAEKEFVWSMTDQDGNERNLLFGPTKLLYSKERYAKLSTTVNGVEYVSTFWNDVSAPKGERVRKVFEPRGSVQTYVVAGKNEPYGGVPCMRGLWFICEF